jgi:uncharacterized repeat protein (TIGR01451 family)
MRRVLASLQRLSETSWLALLVAAIVLCAPHAAQAQTGCAVPGQDGPASLSGVINTYHPGISATTTSLTVGMSRFGGASTPIAAGDLLLVIQMQDADIYSVNNNGRYGDGASGDPGSGSTALNFSGAYEYVVATSSIPLSGGTVSIRGSGAGGTLLYTYTTAAANSTQGQKRFQVVRVPQYSAATLNSSLTAAPWNGDTGGILAFDVAGALNLGGATINLSGMGFRGGGTRQLLGDKTSTATAADYRSLSSLNAHGSKGEGIAGTPHYIYNALTNSIDDTGAEGYPNGSHARGAPGTAGGGGTDSDPFYNQENSGGGGGANGGAGGKGGNTWQGNAATGGFGGVAFTASSTRIVMGGGGGGGSKNNDDGDTAASTGAAGGGIVMIRAGSVSSTATINVNGSNAYDNTLNDGGGGGGAGGSVVFLAGSGGLVGLTVTARGGDGGDAWRGQVANGTPGERHGPGGGGGGGVIYLSGAATSTSVTGGTSGITTTSSDTYGTSLSGNGIVSTSTTTASIPGIKMGSQCLPDLTTTKTTSTASVTNSTTGTTAIYTITVTNAANLGSAIQTNISDALPANFTYASTTSVAATLGATRDSIVNPIVGDTNPSWGVFTIPGGGQVRIIFVVNISRTVITGTYQNPATSTYLDPVRTLANPNGVATDSYVAASSTAEDVTVTSRADMTITKTHTGNFTQGQVGATYTLTPTNSGSGQTTAAVTVTDTLPAGLTPTGFGSTPASWSCSIASQTVTCTRSDALVAPNSYPAITVVVNVSATAPASLTNTATVSGGGQTNTANDSASDPTTINGVADLRIAKTHTGNFTVGVNGTYTLTASNAGSAATSGTITVTDTLPTGLTVASLPTGTGWDCSTTVIGSSAATCTSTTAIAAGATSPNPITLTVVVAPAAFAASPVTNVANISGGGEPAFNNANNSASDATTILPVVDVRIAKTHTGNFTVGINGTYTLTTSNAGTANTSGTITVTDNLPTGLTVASLPSGTGWNCSTTVIGSSTATCTSSTVINAGATSPNPITLTVAVSAAAFAASPVTNVANISGGGEPAYNNANNSVSDATTINGASDMTVAKTHSGNFTRGTTGIYTITVTNAGTANSTGTITVTDTLPTGLTVTSLPSGTGWNCSTTVVGSTTATCTSSTVINAGATSPNTISLTVSVAQSAASSVTNSVSVSGGGQNNTANDTATDATTIVSISDLSLTKVTNSSGSGVGTNATFTVTLTNSGPSDATGVAVRDQLPTGLTYVSSTPSVGSYNSTTGIWTVGNLASGAASPTLQIVARIDVTGLLTNTAQVSASNQPDPDSTPDNNVATEDDQASAGLITAAPSVVLCKTVLGQPCPPTTTLNMAPGSDITYVVNYTNNGGSMAAALTITDPVIDTTLPPASRLKLNDHTYFKIGSIGGTFPAGMSISSIKYSNDGGTTWTYAPASGAGSAPAGYDGNVTNIQVFLAGQLPPGGTTGNITFTVRIK